MAEGRRSGGSGGSGQRFYNEQVKIGDQEFSVLTIVLVVGGGLFLTGSTALSGLMSIDGLMLVLYAIAIITAWRMRTDGIWHIVNQAIAFWIALKLILYLIFTLAPQEYAGVDKQPLINMINQVTTDITSNSPMVNEPYQITVDVGTSILSTGNTILPTSEQVDNNVGGGNPNQDVTTPDTTTTANVVQNTQPVVIINPVATEEETMWTAYQNNDGQTALIASRTILGKVPDHIDAQRIQEVVLIDKSHADELLNMPKVGDAYTSVFFDKVEPAQLDTAKTLLRGGTYLIVQIDKETFSGACNEVILFVLTSGTFAGDTYETQRCIIDVVNGRKVSVGDEIIVR